MKKIILLLIVMHSIGAFTQNKEVYRIYTKSGQLSNYTEMLNGIVAGDVVLFGEYHNNAIIHWLQFELLKDLKTREMELVLGAEMFEADNQLIMDEFLQGLIPEKKFEEEARLWPNYQTDYKPLVRFAKENNIRFVATNVPRRYANIVSKGGFEVLDGLSAEAKKYMAGLPMVYDSSLPGYQKMLKMGGMPSKMSENLPKAQALKDATMAHFIAENLKEKAVFVHFNGSFHSDYFDGIYWYLTQQLENVQLKTISISLADESLGFDQKDLGKADYIVVVNKNVTSTY